MRARNGAQGGSVSNPVGLMSDAGCTYGSGQHAVVAVLPYAVLIKNRGPWANAPSVAVLHTPSSHGSMNTVS